MEGFNSNFEMIQGTRFTLDILGGELFVECEGVDYKDYVDRVKIYFCPMCGRELGTPAVKVKSELEIALENLSKKP